MNSTFLSTYNHGFTWESTENLFAKGFLFDENGTFHENKSLVAYFSEADTEEKFKRKLKNANGLFAVYIKRNNFEAAAVDRIRTFPLFYAIKDESCYVSDSVDALRQKTGYETTEKTAVDELMALAFVSGNKTLIQNIQQIEAGSCLFIRKNDIQCSFYHRALTTDISQKNYSELYNELGETLALVTRRLVKSLKDKPVAIPLSGGYDSRLIAVLLKNAGYENVMCFTYGRKNNYEAQIAQKVAQKLGFRWLFVEYNQDLIRDFIKSPTFDAYYRAAANFSSMFYLQDYFAVKYLREKKQIPADTVFIPGHTGDVLSGGHLKENKSRYEQNLSNEIFRQHFNLHIPKTKSMRRIKESLERYATDIKTHEIPAYLAFENWDSKERQAKFIVNSAQVFRFFDYQYRLPLWDNDLIGFFVHLPFEHKLHSKLYRDYLKNELFIPYEINFENDSPSMLDKSVFRLKKIVKACIPPFIRNRIVSPKNAYHPIYYREITDILKNDMKKNGHAIIKPHNTHYNSFIVQWYLSRL